MGSGASSSSSNRKGKAPEPDYNAIKRETVFKKSELKALFQRYLDICSSNGLVQTYRLGEVQDLRLNNRLIFVAFQYEAERFESGKGTEIDFRTLCMVLSKFSAKTSRQEKEEYLYRILRLDSKVLNRDCYIELVKSITLGTIPEHVAETVASAAWANIAKDDGFIKQKKLSSLLATLDVTTCLTIAF
jgi:Ca2+-binding EF-hand superfamily protein